MGLKLSYPGLQSGRKRKRRQKGFKNPNFCCHETVARIVAPSESLNDGKALRSNPVPVLSKRNPLQRWRPKYPPHCTPLPRAPFLSQSGGFGEGLCCLFAGEVPPSGRWTWWLRGTPSLHSPGTSKAPNQGDGLAPLPKGGTWSLSLRPAFLWASLPRLQAASCRSCRPAQPSSGPADS